MKVLLVLPTHHYSSGGAFLSFSDFPTGFGYITSALKKAGHEVYGCNPNNKVGYKTLKDMVRAEIISSIDSCKPDLIGLGGICTDYLFIRDAIQIIRSVCDAPIVLGGNIVTNDAEFIFNDLKPDYAVVGEGEEAIVRIANGDPHHYTYQTGIIEIPQKEYATLDERSFPDYEPFGVKDMIDNWSMTTRVLYRYSRANPRPYNIVASRSCPFACTFCIHGHRKIKYRARSIPNIMAEIKESYEKYHFNILILLDELFAVSKGRLGEFCDAVLDGKQRFGWDFDWCFQTHPSARFDLDTLRLAKKAGCYLFSYGVESASPTVLRSMAKHSRPEQIAEAINMAHQAGIAFAGNLIFGDPAETLDTMRESLYFWYQHQDALLFLGFVCTYPGSKLFDDCIRDGLIPDKKQFYETIDKQMVNMTKIPSATLQTWFNFLNFLEQSWLFVKSTNMTRYEVDSVRERSCVVTGLTCYRIYAICPHCGREFLLYQACKDIKKEEYMGAACPHCGKRVRVNLGR